MRLSRLSKIIRGSVKAGGTMDTNTIYEAFTIEGGRKQFYQWDTDQKIIVNDRNIDEVHFCNGTSDKSLVSVVKDGKANVPNLLLQTAARVRVYGYSVNHTVVEKVYEVKARTKPEDYVYEETEVLRWAELDKRIQAIEERTAPEEWELIAEETIGEYIGSTYITYGKDKHAFKLTKCMVTLEYAGDTERTINLSCGVWKSGSSFEPTIAKSSETYSAEKKYGTMEVYPNNGYWDMAFYGAMDENGMRPVKGMPYEYHMKHRTADVPYIDAVFVERELKTNTGPIPQGTIVRIWGVRAKD